MNIVMLVSNAVKKDIRVVREAFTLADAGHNVTVFGVGDEFEKGKIGNVNYIVNKKPIFCSLNLFSRKKTTTAATNSNASASSFQINEKANFKNFLKGVYICKLIKSRQSTLYNAVKKLYTDKIDIVYSHDLDMLNAAAKLKKKFNAKLVFDSHELWTEMTGINYYVKKKFTAKESKLIHEADKVITVSGPIADELENRYGLKNSPVLVRNIPELNNPVVNRHNCVNDSLKLIYVGFYLKGRGIEHIIGEFEMVADKNVELYLRISGADSEIDELKKKVSEKGISEKVHILPFVEMNEVVNEIANYDIGILPYFGVSLNNKFCLPNKFFQYLTGGVCVISNDLPEVNSLVSKYKCGMKYSVDGKPGLAEVIEQLDKNHSEVEDLKKNAANAVLTDLNWENEKKRLVRLINDCI